MTGSGRRLTLAALVLIGAAGAATPSGTAVKGCAAGRACENDKVEDEAIMQACENDKVEDEAIMLLQLRQDGRLATNQTEGFVVTTAVVVGVATSVATAALGALAGKAISAAWGSVDGPDSFHHEVGAFGLPLTLSVLNDGNTSVKYSEFELIDGHVWGAPALKRSFEPGEMLQWFLYTHGVDVHATMLLEGGEQSWSIAVAQERFGAVNTGCDRMRVNVLRGRNMKATFDGLCHTLGGTGAGISVRGDYQATVRLKEAGL